MIILDGLEVECTPEAEAGLAEVYDLVSYGKWVATWYRNWNVCGRIITCYEMAALLAYREQQRDELIEQDGCCGKMTDEGRCRGGRWCPIYLKARELLQRVEYEHRTNNDQ